MWLNEDNHSAINMKHFGSIGVTGTKRNTSCLLKVWFQGAGGVSISKCKRAQHGSEQVVPRLELAFIRCGLVLSSLCDSIAEGECSLSLVNT